MTMLSQRDIVLLSFPFFDLKGSRVRPAIVMSNDGYNRSSEDFIAVPITSNLKFRDYAVLITNVSEVETAPRGARGALAADAPVVLRHLHALHAELAARPPTE
ncbi:MAG: type II toxin-antitoxin system PemK/MazF family toxin, partial [Nitrososphaerota archaeon]|nr:type II toxin-antitoxin system PemK/MazF family toxin [Nitrososphaerota archaeon]